MCVHVERRAHRHRIPDFGGVELGIRFHSPGPFAIGLYRYREIQKMSLTPFSQRRFLVVLRIIGWCLCSNPALEDVGGASCGHSVDASFPRAKSHGGGDDGWGGGGRGDTVMAMGGFRGRRV